jgi:hypothetical protein
VVSIVSLRENINTSADRIAEAEVTLTFVPPTNDDEKPVATFVSWNRFSTDFGEVDLGKFSSERKVTGAIKGTFAPLQVPVGVSVAPGVSVEEAASREVQLRDRYIALTGILNKDNALLVQQGTVGVDVGGNVSFESEIEVAAQEVTATAFLNLFNKEAKPTEPSLVGI